MLSTEGYVFQSKFALENQAKGRAKGRAEGLAKGRVKGLGKALLLTLTKLNLVVTPAERERIMACTDPAVLEQWIERAFGANSVQEIFV